MFTIAKRVAKFKAQNWPIRTLSRLPSLWHAARLLGPIHGAMQQRLVGLMLVGYLREPVVGGSALEVFEGVSVIGEVG